MLNHTKFVRPTSSISSKSVSNYLEVLDPQPNDDIHLLKKNSNKKLEKDSIPLRSKSSLSYYKNSKETPMTTTRTTTNPTSFLLNPTTTTTTTTKNNNNDYYNDENNEEIDHGNYTTMTTNNSYISSSPVRSKSKTKIKSTLSGNNSYSSGSGSMKMLSKELCDLKIEEIKTRVSNHRLKTKLNSLNSSNNNGGGNDSHGYSNNHQDTNTMKILSDELDDNYTISSSKPSATISSNNKYKAYLEKSPEIMDNLFGDLKPSDYEDPSLYYLEQFLLKIMNKDYKAALPLARQVVKYDPYNSICKDYITVLQKKIEQDEKNGNDDDEDGEDSEDDDDEDSEEDDSEDDDSEDDSDDSDDSDDDDEDEDEDSDVDEEEEEEEEEE